MAQITFAINVAGRFDVPVGTPGSYKPWQQNRAFIWQDMASMEMRSEPTLDGISRQVNNAAGIIFSRHPGDDLEALKLKVEFEVNGVRFAIDHLYEKD